MAQVTRDKETITDLAKQAVADKVAIIDLSIKIENNQYLCDRMNKQLH